jgi:hypothetical protein
MASVIYNTFKQRLMDGEVDFDTDQFYVFLSSNAFTPNADTQNVYTDVSASEITGVNYVAGGTLLTGVTVTLNLSTDKAILTANNVTWASSTITARYCTIYKKAGSSPVSWLVASFDFGSDKSSSAGDFTVQWNASGIIDLT